MSNLIGQSLGRYHILEQLGEGGMAVVYKAFDTRLETDVAVKVIRIENILPSVLEKSLKRFEREAKSLAKLTHPNIVKVTDYGEHEGKPYLVMSYLPGGTLKERLKSGAIPWQEAVQLLLPIAHALEYAHEHNLIHRDVKPSNILLTEKGQPMLTDFGVAKLFDVDETAELTGTGMGIGTPEYMAPEQWTGHVTPQTDIYALGVVLYEMVAGRKPYQADTPAALLLKQANDPLPRPRSFVSGLPDAVEKVLFKALAKSLEDRYQGMGEMVKAMEGLLAGKPVKEAKPVRRVKEETLTAVELDLGEKTQVDEKPILRGKSTRRGWGWGVVAAGIVLLILLAIIISKPSAFTFSPTETAMITPTALDEWVGKIAFISDRDGDFEIYVMEGDGSNIVQLTNNIAADLDPTWSPDGSKIAFASNQDRGYQIYVMNADGSNIVNLTNSVAGGFHPVWSPDGHKIAFTSGGDIYIMNADGSNPINLTSGYEYDIYYPAYNPAWSSDSSKIAFVSYADGDHEIYVMNADGSNIFKLTNYIGEDWDPAWSPDGQKIAFMRFGSENGGDIYIVNTDGSNLVNLTRGYAYYVHGPAWSPDGSKIAFASDQDGIWTIYIMNADGTNISPLTNGSSASFAPIQ